MADDQTQVNEQPAVESVAAGQAEVVEQATQAPPPIQAPPAPEEEQEEEESEGEEEQEENHAVAHLEHRHHTVHTAWELTQTYGLQALLWLQFCWTWVSFFGSKGYEISKNVVRTFQPHIFIYFQGSTYPYRVQDYAIAGAGVAPVEWFFDADKQMFIASNLYNTTTEYEPRHFEWLSGQIKYNDLLLYDITEFLQEVRWAGNERPSPAHILSAWSLSSGIVLNLTEGLTLCTINEDGTESVLPLHR
jgi:hypothetical protein